MGLGAGLVLAWIIRRVQAGWAHLWPLVGGVFVGALGVLVGLHSPWSIVWHAWPLLIVAVGFWATWQQASALAYRHLGIVAPPRDGSLF